MQNRNLILITLPIAALALLGGYFIGSNTAPSPDDGGLLRLPPFNDRIIKTVADCMPGPYDQPCPPCPPPRITCDILYVLKSDRIGSPLVDLYYSYDSTDQSITVRWDISHKIAKEDSARISQPPSEQFLCREYPEKLSDFYWNDRGNTRSSSLPLELEASYGARYEKTGDVKVEIHVIFDAMKNSLLYGVKLTPRRNGR